MHGRIAIRDSSLKCLVKPIWSHACRDAVRSVDIVRSNVDRFRVYLHQRMFRILTPDSKTSGGAEFAILRRPILAYPPLRFGSRLKIVIMFMVFPVDRRPANYLFAIISLNTVIKTKKLKFS